ncbi:MAG: molybdenum cofactor guanylyltransferase [Euryarchaeota archaeon]
MCGGLSSRMGQDKGLMPFKNKPMVCNILDKVDNQMDEVLLVLRNDKQKQEYQKILNHIYSVDNTSFNLKFLKDEIESQGPLSGIYTGLSHMESDYALVIPCDSPFISTYFIEKVYNVYENSKEIYDALIPFWGVKNNHHFEPLHGIYHKRSKKTIYFQLLKGKKDVKSLVKKLNTIFVEVSKLDPSLKSFKNFNRPEDVSKI